MSDAEIEEGLLKDNSELADLGVTTSVAGIILRAQIQGDRYEDRTDRHGGTSVTPMNCLMGLLDTQPDLQGLSPDKFKSLARTVSRIGMAVGTLVDRKPGTMLPKALLLPLKNPIR